MSEIRTIGAAEIDTVVGDARGAILDFYQASCAPCRVLEPRLERLADTYRGRVPVYRIDVDRDAALAESFAVRSLPTVLLLRQGSEVERLDGLISKADLERVFTRAENEQEETR